MKTYQSSLVLKSAFARIKKQNSAISIRALATKIGVSHVFLSRVIHGKVAVPASRLKDFIRAFQLDPFAEKELKDAMIADLSASDKISNITKSLKKNQKKKAINVYDEHPVKHQVVLENWYELPILDYLTCDKLPKDAESIAGSLAIRPQNVELALKKMFDARLVKKNDEGHWIKTHKFIRFSAAAPTDILKRYYTDVLKRTTAELSKDAQEDYDRRLIINFSIATTSERIKEVKEKLSQFLYDLSVEMADGQTDEVYHLTLALIPLTKPHGKKL